MDRQKNLEKFTVRGALESIFGRLQNKRKSTESLSQMVQTVIDIPPPRYSESEALNNSSESLRFISSGIDVFPTNTDNSDNIASGYGSNLQNPITEKKNGSSQFFTRGQQK